MKLSSLTGIGNLLVLLILPLYLSASAEIKTTVESDNFGRYVLVVSSTDVKSIEPEENPVCPGALVYYMGKSTNFSWINGKSASSISMQFNINLQKDGEYTVKPFRVRVNGETRLTEEVKFKASGSGGANSMFSNEDESDEELDIIPVVKIPDGRFYQGSAIPLRYYVLVPLSGNLNYVFAENPVSQGMYLKSLDYGVKEETITVYKGKKYRQICVGTFCVVPLKSGVFDAAGGSIYFSYEGKSVFNSVSNRELKFPVKQINILKLPDVPKGEAASSSGMFKLVPGKVPDKTAVYSGINVKIKIEGEGNLFTVADPAIRQNADYQYVIKSEEPVIRSAENKFYSEKIYSIEIIPLKPGHLKDVKFEFNFFNPDAGRYYALNYSLPDVIVDPLSESSESVDDAPVEESTPLLNQILDIIVIVVSVSIGVLLLIKLKKIISRKHSKKSSGKDIFRADKESDEHKESDSPFKASGADGVPDYTVAAAELYARIVSLENIGGEMCAAKQYLESVKYGGVKPDEAVLRDIELRLKSNK